MKFGKLSPLMHEAGGTPSSLAATVAIAVRDEAERLGIKVTYATLALVSAHADLYARALEDGAAFAAWRLMPPQLIRTRNRVRDEFRGVEVPR